MTTIERSIDIQAPASTAYRVWSRFDLFPEFMDGVEEVRQEGERRLHWRAVVGKKTEEWDAEITEQIPDKRIAWRSQDGASNAGCVTFHRIGDDRSKVMLQLEYEPEKLSEKIGDALGVMTRRVEQDLRRFKDFVETRGGRIEGRPGAVPAKPDAGQKQGPSPTPSRR